MYACDMYACGVYGECTHKPAQLSKVASMVIHRMRRWHNFKPTSRPCIAFDGNEYMRDTCIHPVKLCITVRVSVRPSSICICMLRDSTHFLGQYCAIPPLWIFRGLSGWKLCLRPLRLFYVRL